MKAIIALVVLLLLHLIASKAAYAVSVSITNYPATITDEPFNITASISGASTGTNYLRIDIYKDGTTNYFGETYNGSDWYSGSDGKQYFPVTIVDSKSTASASLQARIGVPNSSDYDGQGSYKMRIRRYTNSGGQGSEDANNSAVSVAINVPTPTPVPTNTSTSTPITTSTPKPTPTPTKSPTPTPKPSTPAPSVLPTKVSLSEDVLGEASESATMSSLVKPLASKVPKKEKIISSAKEDNFGKILIILGFVFILACGILFSWPFIRKKLKKDEW